MPFADGDRDMFFDFHASVYASTDGTGATFFTVDGVEIADVDCLGDDQVFGTVEVDFSGSRALVTCVAFRDQRTTYLWHVNLDTGATQPLLEEVADGSYDPVAAVFSHPQ